MKQLKLFDLPPMRDDVLAYAKYWCDKQQELKLERYHSFIMVVEYLKKRPWMLLKLNRDGTFQPYQKNNG